MRAVIQRVKQSSVKIEGKLKAEIKAGLLVLLGIEINDIQEDVDWLCEKICQLRIFNDRNGMMNLSLKDVDGEMLVISQFTLFAKTKKGNRPSYMDAAKPGTAIPLYNYFIARVENFLEKKIGTGEFGEMMDIFLINDGPVTIFIDTKSKE
jgi:D-aminoacyl-tRNA deacylase